MPVPEDGTRKPALREHHLSASAPEWKTTETLESVRQTFLTEKAMQSEIGLVAYQRDKWETKVGSDSSLGIVFFFLRHGLSLLLCSICVAIISCLVTLSYS